MPSKTKTLKDDFVKLGSEVYLRRPSINGSSVDDAESPNIIIVFGWMGAHLKHVQKYTKVYEELYPFATQILVTSPPSFFWSTQSTKNATLTPVVEILEALGVIPGLPSMVLVKPEKPRILIHSFSNGGAYCLLILGKLLSTRPMPSDASNRLPCALIIDSAPGGGGMGHAINAFTAHIHNGVTKTFSKVFVGTIYVLAYMVGPMLGRKTSLQKVREALYDAHLLPWMGKDTPRLYIYSKEDEMVPWVDTETHAHASKAMGRNVTTLVFEDSPHVAHARTHPTEYWDAVKSHWRKAITP